MAGNNMRNVSIKMDQEARQYIREQKPNQSEFVRRLIHQHRDMQALADGLKAGRQAREGGSPA